MPPPSCSSKISQTSKDRECDCDYECSKKNISVDESAVDLKRETVKYMKTLLGPSLEDAVLKTIEFGRTIIHKKQVLSDVRIPTKEDKLLDVLRKEVAGSNSKNGLDLDYIFSEGRKIMKEQKNAKKKPEKCVGFKNKTEKNLSFCQKPLIKKFPNVSKIRSLDSDLKHDACTPEKIKRQLEALIQINKVNRSDPGCKRGGKWNLGLSAPKFPVEMTIMPSFCLYKNETDTNGSCEVQESNQEAAESKTECERIEEKKTSPGKIGQAPEFISNALGPTLDVSIIDNLKMMRDLFKCDSAKGEGSQKPSSVKQEVRLQNSEMEMNCRIVALQKKIEELEHKEQCLAKQIEDEEHERNFKRKAFEEEERKLFGVRSCFDKISARPRKGNTEVGNLECNLEALKLKVACEEEKLMKLKNESDCFKRELAEAWSRKQNLKRNKSLLDAWDVIASRVCHTRLPSFSRVSCLERKQFTAGDNGNLHCCFPILMDETAQCNNKGSKKCDSRCGFSDTHCGAQSKCQNTWWSQNWVPSPCSNSRASCSDSGSCSKDRRFESQSNLICKIKMGEILFPVQRDVSCGLHQVLKSCTCRPPVRREGHLCSSDDDLMRKMKTMRTKCEHQNSFKIPNFSSNKAICASRSDTSLKRGKCSKIVKVMWATTRINVFQDNSRTYEVMDATSSPPICPPVRTEGIFVVKNSKQKVCPSSSKNCPPCLSEY